VNVAAEHRALVAQIKKHEKKGGDAWLQKYVGSPLPVLGLSVPQMRAILAAFRKGHRGATAKDANALAGALWRGTTFEEKALAIMMMDAHAKILDEASWGLLDGWVDGCVGWGMCDSIGAGPIAKVVHAKPGRFRELLRWAKSANPWRRRIALYALHDYVLAKELDKPFTLLEKLVYDENGQLLTQTFMDYLLPTIAEVPKVEIGHIETPSPLNPLGVKGAGEAGVIPVAAVFASALDDALGTRIVEMPLSHARLLELVRATPVGT